MNDNLTVIVGVCVVAGGIAYGMSHMSFGPAVPEEKKVVYVSSGTRAEDIGSRKVGNLYPDHRYWLKCERQWKDNWQMREYCENQQEAAKDWASSTVIDDDVAHRCARQWSDDWNMFKYCVNNQTTAKEKVKARLN